MLGFLGISVEEDTQIERRFVLWKENEVAFFLFYEVAFIHKQWITRGMDGALFALDGNFLLSYLKLNYKKKKKVKALLEDIQIVADGWLSVINKKEK